MGLSGSLSLRHLQSHLRDRQTWLPTAKHNPRMPGIVRLEQILSPENPCPNPMVPSHLPPGLPSSQVELGHREDAAWVK